MSVSRLYHIGQPKTIKFKIEGDDSPVAITMKVFDSQGNPLTEEIKPSLIDRAVDVTLPVDTANEVGDYVATFRADMGKDKPPLEFPMYFAVTSPSMAERARGTAIEMLTPQSTRNDLEDAMSKTLKQLRRTMDAQEAQRVAMNTARIKTEKDWFPKEIVQQEIRDAMKGIKVTLSL